MKKIYEREIIHLGDFLEESYEEGFIILFGEKANDPLAMYLEDICTVPANLAGIPGISIPAGMSSSNLPIGLQLLGPAMGEETLLRAAFTFEQARPDCQLVAPTGEVSL